MTHSGVLLLPDCQKCFRVIGYLLTMRISIPDRLRLKALYRGIASRHLLILFIVAFFLGFGIKSLIRDTVTIGYDDYTLPQPDTLVDLNTLEKELIKNGITQEKPVPRGDTCKEEA